ncbi:hypothetical protein PN36_21900 [Candidatus Thiomargarita nelsonii]|uniref:Uncharacterized protein n=1 Tax=Candidatus Thiomargarita nelsonii TaxID=1003181 RepID=A0A0A6PDF3_9GAMM|nr:hypothetical protein PN36_21900 [Candidatus Thiomargarita nelsonii]
MEIPSVIKKSIKEEFPYGKKGTIIFSVNQNSYLVQENAGNLKVSELIIITFELSEELVSKKSDFFKKSDF